MTAKRIPNLARFMDSDPDHIRAAQELLVFLFGVMGIAFSLVGRFELGICMLTLAAFNLVGVAIIDKCLKR